MDARARRRDRQRAARARGQRHHLLRLRPEHAAALDRRRRRRGSAARRGAGNTITGIGCATDDLCLLSTDRGDRLLRTRNGGGTAETITASTAALYAAGYTSPTRAVAVGAGGATVISDDAGRNYAPIGGDIAGCFQFGLRLGPAPGIALALGARGQLARTTDDGRTWKAINVATSADMQDTSFTTADQGYALDQRGGLFRTSNGGQSWSPIDPGTTSPPRAVITTGDTVLLAGPRGISRAAAGGEFNAVNARRPPSSTSTAAAARSSPTARRTIMRTTNARTALGHGQAAEPPERVCATSR